MPIYRRASRWPRNRWEVVPDPTEAPPEATPQPLPAGWVTLQLLRVWLAVVGAVLVAGMAYVGAVFVWAVIKNG
ncbi:MAG: hypothetical protein NVS9B10_15120 [Nevskia sp.]